MWVMTTTGFISISQRLPQDRVLTGRARDRLSLYAVCDELGLKRSEIIHTIDADYEFRLELTRSQVDQFLRAQLYGVDYPNFKDRVSKTRGRRWHDALLDVWVAMLGVSTTRNYRRDLMKT